MVLILGGANIGKEEIQQENVKMFFG